MIEAHARVQDGHDHAAQRTAAGLDQRPRPFGVRRRHQGAVEGLRYHWPAAGPVLPGPLAYSGSLGTEVRCRRWSSTAHSTAGSRLRASIACRALTPAANTTWSRSEMPIPGGQRQARALSKGGTALNPQRLRRISSGQGIPAVELGIRLEADDQTGRHRRGLRLRLREPACARACRPPKPPRDTSPSTAPSS